MATNTVSANVGSKRTGGGHNAPALNPSGTPDLSITVNSTVVTRAAFISACQALADQLGLK